MMYRHESFQLWESEIKGLLIQQNNDFVTLNKDGINVFALGKTNKRVIIDNESQERMIHSFESMNYIKVDPLNILVFANQKMDKREVQV